MMPGVFDLELSDQFKRSSDELSDMEEDDEYMNVQDVINIFLCFI